MRTRVQDYGARRASLAGGAATRTLHPDAAAEIARQSEAIARLQERNARQADMILGTYAALDKLCAALDALREALGEPT